MQWMPYLSSSLIIAITFPLSVVAQGSTPPDLLGATIDASVQNLRQVQTDFGRGASRGNLTWRIAIGTDGVIQTRHVVTVTRPNGQVASQTFSSKSPPGKPFDWRDGKAVWVFDTGSLCCGLSPKVA